MAFSLKSGGRVRRSWVYVFEKCIAVMVHGQAAAATLHIVLYFPCLLRVTKSRWLSPYNCLEISRLTPSLIKRDGSHDLARGIWLEDSSFFLRELWTTIIDRRGLTWRIYREQNTLEAIYEQVWLTIDNCDHKPHYCGHVFSHASQNWHQSLHVTVA